MAIGKYIYWQSEEGLTLLRGWARDGYTDDQIADKIDISRSTFYEWKKRFPDIADALKKSKAVYDNEVVEDLKRSTKGYYVWEEDEKIDECGNMVTVARRKRWIPANTSAQIFWLKNRMRDSWQDKVEQEITGKDGGAINIQQVADADVDKRIRELEAKLK